MVVTENPGTPKPTPTSNTSLPKAAAVVKVLRQDAQMADFRILPLSAAQLIQTDQTVAAEL
jgi:hypothetical protein